LTQNAEAVLCYKSKDPSLFFVSPGPVGYAAHLALN